VNQAVTHASHCSPLDRWVLGAKLVRDFLGLLADDFETPHKRPSKSIVQDEGFER